MPPRQTPPRPALSIPNAEEVMVNEAGGEISPVPTRSPAEIISISLTNDPIPGSTPASHKFPELSKAKSWIPRPFGESTFRPGFGAPLASRSLGANFHNWFKPTESQRLSDESKRSTWGNQYFEEIAIRGDGRLLSNWFGGTCRS